MRDGFLYMYRVVTIMFFFLVSYLISLDKLHVAAHPVRYYLLRVQCTYIYLRVYNAVLLCAVNARHRSEP